MKWISRICMLIYFNRIHLNTIFTHETKIKSIRLIISICWLELEYIIGSLHLSLITHIHLYIKWLLKSFVDHSQWPWYGQVGWLDSSTVIIQSSLDTFITHSFRFDSKPCRYATLVECVFYMDKRQLIASYALEIYLCYIRNGTES